MFNTTSKFRLYLAFMLIITLMIVMVGLGIAGARIINERISTIVLEYNKKTELVSTMLASARQRTIILHEFLLIEDPFERDEQTLIIDALGAKFATARSRLLAMSLSEEEKNILDKQGELSGIAVRLQREIVSLAADEKMAEAQLLLVKKTVPAQDAVLQQLDSLISLVNKASQDSMTFANQTAEETRNNMTLLGGIAILISTVLAYFVTNRIIQTESKLHTEKEKAITTLSSIGDGVIVTDHHKMIESINHVAEHILGMASANVTGKFISEVFQVHHEDTMLPIIDPVTLALGRNKTSETDDPPVLKISDGSYVPIESHASPIHSGKGDLIGSVLVFRDVTQSRVYAKEIEYQATHDSLTGLYNRSEFDRHLQKVHERLKKHPSENVLMFIDLDHFKKVNDTAGHAAGDEMLRRLSRLMHDTFRQRDYISRRGGDEFAVLMENCDLATAGKTANNLLQNIKQYSLEWNQLKCQVGASIGLTQINSDDESIDTVLHHADVACYVAKHGGRGRIEIYSEEMDSNEPA
jgi:diguanylate cyclase (GGDEF)-like protein/PAS domain S-box-containing protein